MFNSLFNIKFSDSRKKSAITLYAVFHDLFANTSLIFTNAPGSIHLGSSNFVTLREGSANPSSSTEPRQFTFFPAKYTSLGLL